MLDTFDKTSFIPKKSLAPISKRKPSVGLYFIISVIVFLLATAGSVGVIVYKAYVEGGIESKAVSLQRAKEAFDPRLIDDLSRLDNRIESSGNILSSHIALTPLFDLLEELTLKNVRFEQFEFLVLDSGEMTLVMTGEAVNHATVVLQSDLLGQSRFLKDQIFSDINPDRSGNIGFSLEATVDPSLVSFRGNVEGL